MVAVKAKRNRFCTLLLISSILLAGVLAGCSPYSSQFSCPGTYDGVCESPQDAYNDSVNGIDPRQFDPEWREEKKKWAEKHKALIEARKQAAGGNSTGEAPDYRKTLFKELREVLEEPETPIVIPPRIGRALILGHADGEMFIPPHYIYFMLDRPRWVLKKFPERENRSIDHASVLKKVAEKEVEEREKVRHQEDSFDEVPF